MSQVNLNELSSEELAQLVKAAQEEKNSRQKQEVRDAYMQFQQIAKSIGVSVEDILKIGRTIKNKRPIKYQNPQDKSQGWSGQGRKPQWLAAQLAKGKKLEDFLI